MKANHTSTLRPLLESSKPGDVLVIEGYAASDRSISDLTVVKLAHDDYRNMQKASLDILRAFAPGRPEEAEARQAMIESLSSSLFGEKTAVFKDIYRDAGGFHVHKDAGALDEVYVLRVAVLSSSTEEPMPKSPAAVHKKQLAAKLDLPSARYRHSLKFADGSFKSVELLKAPLSQEMQAKVDMVLGKCETNETDETVSKPAT